MDGPIGPVPVPPLRKKLQWPREILGAAAQLHVKAVSQGLSWKFLLVTGYESKSGDM